MKTLIAAALLAPFSIFAASPAATQDWVRHYVETNTASIAATGFDVSPIVVNVTNETGETETITLSFTVNESRALRIEQSSLPGMTNGTYFAEVGTYAYRNTGNTACTEITGAYEQFGTMKTDGHYEYITNGATVVTNAIYSTTNEVWMTRYVAHVGGVAFMSVETQSGLHYFTATNSASTFYARSCYISSAKKNELTAETVSLWSLLLPSAYAVKLGEKIVTGTETDGMTVYTHWEQYYYTDSKDAQHITIGDVTITTASGQKMTYTLDIVLLDIPEGVKVTDLSLVAHIPTDDEIFNALADSIGINRTRQFLKSSAWKDAINAKIAQIEKILSALDAVIAKCPIKGTDTTDAPPPDPETPPEHECTKFSGHCGHWTCVECRKTYKAPDADHPAKHVYEFRESGKCATCRICGAAAPASLPQWHTGWHDLYYIGGDYTSKTVPHHHYCACACGVCALSHLEKDETVRYDADADNPLACWEVWRCKRCHQVVDPVSDSDTGGWTRTRTAHDETTNGRFSDVVVDGKHVCRLSYTCAHRDGDGNSLGCGAQRTEDLQHVPDWSKAVVSYQGNDSHHVIKAPCVNGFTYWTEDFGEWYQNNPNWCGYCLNTNKKHRVSHEVKMWNDDDYPASDASHVVVYICGNVDDMTYDGRTTCGRVWVSNENHKVMRQDFAYRNELHHDISNYCGKCDGVFFDGTEAHVRTGDDTCNLVDMFDHTVSNYCNKCHEYYPVGSGYESHKPIGGFHTYAYKSDNTHDVSNYCGRCHGWYFDRLEEHDSNSKPFAYNGWGNHSRMHSVSNICNCCGHAYCSDPYESCTPSDDSWTLRDDESTDIAVCKFCGEEGYYGHSWSRSPTHHWCNHGAGHLEEPHSFGDDGICTVCSYNNATGAYPKDDEEQDETETEETVYCPGCLLLAPSRFACYAIYRGSRLISSHCAAGWNASNRKCGCIGCQNGLGTCECCIAFWNRYYPNDTVTNSSQVATGLAFSPVPGGNDGVPDDDDCESGAEIEAFSGNGGNASWSGNGGSTDCILPFSADGFNGMGTVTSIGAGTSGGSSSPITSLIAPTTITNVCDRAFYGCHYLTNVTLFGVESMGLAAFSDCESLTTFTAPKLTTVGRSAFANCGNLRQLDLPSLMSVNEWFLDESAVTNVSFASLATAPAYFLSSCHSLKEIHLPSLTYASSMLNYVSDDCQPHIFLSKNCVIQSFDGTPTFHLPATNTINGVAYPANEVIMHQHSCPIVWED